MGEFDEQPGEVDDLITPIGSTASPVLSTLSVQKKKLLVHRLIPAPSPFPAKHIVQTFRPSRVLQEPHP